MNIDERLTKILEDYADITPSAIANTLAFNTDKAKAQIKALMVEVVGENRDNTEQDSLKKYFGDIRFDDGYNQAKQEIRDRINKERK